MRGRKSELKVRMDEETRETLHGWLRKQKVELGLAKRAWAMLLLAQGEAFSHVAAQVGLAERHVRKWAKRFVREGSKGLFDKPRPGRKPVFSPSSSSTFGENSV
jgi:Winged helix-turn helix